MCRINCISMWLFLFCFLAFAQAAEPSRVSTVQAALDNLNLASPLLMQAQQALTAQQVTLQELTQTLLQQKRERMTERQSLLSKLESSATALSQSQSAFKSAKSSLTQAESNYQDTLASLAKANNNLVKASVYTKLFACIAALEALMILLSIALWAIKKHCWP